jgi:hypothetical protein
MLISVWWLYGIYSNEYMGFRMCLQERLILQHTGDHQIRIPKVVHCNSVSVSSDESMGVDLRVSQDIPRRRLRVCSTFIADGKSCCSWIVECNRKSLDASTDIRQNCHILLYSYCTYTAYGKTQGKSNHMAESMNKSVFG